MSKRLRIDSARLGRVAAVCGVVLIIVIGLGDLYYSLAPIDYAKQLARVLVTPVLALAYRQDSLQAAKIADSYSVGFKDASVLSVRQSWQAVEGALPGFHLLREGGSERSAGRIPFVYEDTNSAHLRKFRDEYRLDIVIAGEPDEYQAMLRLGGWLGTRWDHGTDEVPGGREVCDPSAVIAAGGQGARFWCEIASRTAVQAANSLGWISRLITLSGDGYTWEHAVAELWSNQFNKWFVLDTDFNVVYEQAGIPLSAFELMNQGESLAKSGRLTVRSIASKKPSLPYRDLLPFSRYIHVDLRSDWCTRRLRPGSPANGDRNSWWTAQPTFHRILTAMPRVDDVALFNWPVNDVQIYLVGAKRVAPEQLQLKVAFSAYSPTFKSFEMSLDQTPWASVQGAGATLQLPLGRHVLRVRCVTAAGWTGPTSDVEFEYQIAKLGYRERDAAMIERHVEVVIKQELLADWFNHMDGQPAKSMGNKS